MRNSHARTKRRPPLFSFFLVPFQPLELAARLNCKELFYHMIFKEREIQWQYGSRVNYNLDLRVVDGALQGRTACLFSDEALF